LHKNMVFKVEPTNLKLISHAMNNHIVPM